MLGFVLVATVLGPPGPRARLFDALEVASQISATTPAATISISSVRGGRNGHGNSSEFSGVGRSRWLAFCVMSI